MELENVFTQGTQGIPAAGDPKRSSYNVPSNEDWQMVVEVVSVDDGLVEGRKIWDAAEEYTSLYARLEYSGREGTPPDSSVAVGQHVIFSRVGDFASQGSNGYELHTEDAEKCSLVCLIESSPFVYVKDSGEGSGTEVTIDETGNVQVPQDAETLSLLPVDPTSFFHDSSPPYAAGRIYPAVKLKDEEGVSKAYIVYLPAKGNLVKTFTATADTIQFSLGVDGQGNVVSFTAASID